MLLLIVSKAGARNTEYLSSWLLIKDIMNKHIPDFSGFPTDNSSTTNLRYDIVASKFMTGVRNHDRRAAPVQSSGVVLYVLGAVLELALAVLMTVFVGLHWIWKRL